MKMLKTATLMIATALMLTACSPAPTDNGQPPVSEKSGDVVEIVLADGKASVDGVPADSNQENAVYLANDIVYYEDGKDFTYGEGSVDDAHPDEEAKAHTVVHITKAGTYSVSGTLPKGQIAIDLGEDAKDDPEAVVTLILNGVDITCEVAPAIIFYNVYECGSDDTEGAVKDVDTSGAGANVIIADRTENVVNGSYVARIYKPDSVVLNDEGTEVVDSKKLHKYDGAFYSKTSMNVGGGEEGNGKLTINAENEGLDSELHLTVNGGIININSGNDGINTNEDGVSVTTINGGELYIKVNGETGEGDGIDSNGWLVINGGLVNAQACSFSGDAGIDSDMGIHINGGTVIATGHMLDRIEEGGQNYAVFSFASKQNGGETVVLKNEADQSVMEACPENGYSILIYSAPELSEGKYTLWSDGVQLSGASGKNMMGRPGMNGMRPEGEDMPEMPRGERPEGFEPPQRPEGQIPERPEGMEFPQWDKGEEGKVRRPESWGNIEVTAEFIISNGGNTFQNITVNNG